MNASQYLIFNQYPQIHREATQTSVHLIYTKPLLHSHGVQKSPSLPKMPVVKNPFG